ILRAHPEFSWVSYSSADGSFTGAFHSSTTGETKVNQSTIADGKTALVEHVVEPDGSWRESKREADTGYDPRTRPFYQLAAKGTDVVWTDPYVFYDEGVPGITCAAPVRDASGALLGVFTIDFDLNSLSKLVAELSRDLSAHGEVFVI